MTSPARHATRPSVGTDRPRPAFLAAAGCLMVGVVVHVPAVWTRLAGPERAGHRSWYQRAAAGFGQWPITILCGFVALLLVGSLLASSRRGAGES